MEKIEVVGTGLRRYVIEVHRRNDDALLLVSNPQGKKVIIKLLLRGDERRKLARALGGEA